MSKIELGPLPDPDQVWMTQGLGPMRAYTADQMRAYAEAEVAKERERLSALCATKKDGDHLAELRMEGWSEIELRAYEVACESIQEALLKPLPALDWPYTTPSTSTTNT